ncbi:peptidylprolyl isomerase [Pseudaminobacter soli (ex Li et al. 2025)]|uniref:Parvulin-like PPIase n=1 Tax=Pseudaminobacter soli (ex Li et al. 2025) TaxID=1295366 RepID=A0A2P7RXI2_9HYPH|nr:peptidylprolyl isomerase [Mesorhizobium soli]PSJ54928.1 peptidylprolyl isomerase [Mesorhizobium soli]
MPFSFRRASLASLGVMLALSAPAAMQAFAQETPPAAEAPAKPVDPAAVIATVNGKPITEGDLQVAESDLDQQFSRLPAEQRRAAALSAVIEIRLLAGEAEAKGLDKNPDFQRRMEFLKDRALHSEVVEKEVSKAITDDEIRARYDKEIAAAPPVNEVHARHILVKTKEEAEAIIKQLDGGAKFEDLAKEKSSDPGSGANGGDLGYFGPGQMVPEFEKAAFALEPGSYTKEPVKTQFGWHIIKVEDKRTQQPPAFDQVKAQIRSLLLRDKYFELVKSLRGNAKVDVTDPDLKKAVDQIDQSK